MSRMDKNSRPFFSPYVFLTAPLQFAEGRMLFIPPHLLFQSQKLETMHLENRLNFPDVSEDVGHVIIHYLYTGTYQSLRPSDSEPQKAFVTEFSTSIRAYNAAKTYELPNLAELAKAEIERLGEKLQISVVFDILQEVCPNPCTDDVWLSDFLKNRLKSSLRGGVMNPPLQSKTGIPAKTVPISHILFKGMLELFQEKEESRLEKISNTFEVVAGNRPGFPLASSSLFVNPAVESNLYTIPAVMSNMHVGELEGNPFKPDDMWGLPWINKRKDRQVNTTTPVVVEKNHSEDISMQDVGTNQYEKTENGPDSMGSLNEKEGKEQASPKVQQQANRENEQAEKEAREQINQETAKFLEEGVIAAEEAEILALVFAREHSLFGLNTSDEQRLHLLQARAKERSKEQASHKAEESVKGLGMARRKCLKCKKSTNGIDPLSGRRENHPMVKQQTKDNNKEGKDDLWASLRQEASKGKQKMDRDSESKTPEGHSSDNDSSCGLWSRTKLDDDEELKEKGWSF